LGQQGHEIPPPNSLFVAVERGKHPSSPQAPGPMALKLPVDHANVVLLDVLTHRSVTSSIEAMRS
jgi:hypothetical protein